MKRIFEICPPDVAIKFLIVAILYLIAAHFQQY